MFTATDWIRDKNGLMVLTPFPIKWAGKAAKQVYHKLRQKDTGNDATSRTFLQRKGSVFVQPLSLTSFDSSPSRGASGETVHFAGTAKASPTRGGGSASALTERLYKGKPALCSKARPFAPCRASGIQWKVTRPAKGSPFGATATTAASGGNREELLGQRPAGCERQRSRRWVPQPGQCHRR